MATAPKLLSEAAHLSHQVTANSPAQKLYMQDELGEEKSLNISISTAMEQLLVHKEAPRS